MKDIPGFEGIYAVTQEGKVWSYPREKSSKYGKYLKPTLQRHGYLAVALWKDKKQNTTRIHRIVALTFIPNPHNLPCVDHVDRNKSNNSLNNLRWVTYSLNTINCKDRQTDHPRGVRQTPSGKFAAYSSINYRQIHLGTFASIAEANRRVLEFRPRH